MSLEGSSHTKTVAASFLPLESVVPIVVESLSTKVALVCSMCIAAQPCLQLYLTKLKPICNATYATWNLLLNTQVAVLTDVYSAQYTLATSAAASYDAEQE